MSAKELRRLRPKNSRNWHLDHFKIDIDRMVAVCADRGYLLERPDAAWAWEQYSESLAAGWLGLHKSDQAVFDCLMIYLEPEKVKVDE